MGFSKDFIFGLATSAAQIEGGAYEDGRGPSIWDEFAKKPGRIHDNVTPDKACDSYHRFDRDLQNLIDVGVDSYRMSISWSRVLPEGKGDLNQAGVDYYKRCFEKLLSAGIKPHCRASKGRWSPGARFLAMSAASMGMVPLPQKGSQKGSLPR